MGHLENAALARAIRLTGGSNQPVRVALDLRCEMCTPRQKTDINLPAKLHAHGIVGDRVGVDLFALADYKGRTKDFLNVFDWASTIQIVSKLKSTFPKQVWMNFLNSWIAPFGKPKPVALDQGGEFERELAQELESAGVDLRPVAAYCPTRNSITERHGGMWKEIAKKLIGQYSIDFEDKEMLQWLIAMTTWAANSGVGEKCYSVSQWVLGRGISLPYDLMDEAHRFSLHERICENKRFEDRIGMMAAAQRALTSLRHNTAMSKAFLARSRANISAPGDTMYNVGDQVYYWRGNGKRKRDLGSVLVWSSCRCWFRGARCLARSSKCDPQCPTVLLATCTTLRKAPVGRCIIWARLACN